MVNFTEKEKGPVYLWWEGHNRSDTDVHLEVQAIQRVQINKSSHATTTPDEDQSSVG